MQNTETIKKSLTVKAPFTRKDINSYFTDLKNKDKDHFLVNDIVIGLAKNEDYYDKYLKELLGMTYEQYLTKIKEPVYMKATKKYLHSIIDSLDYDNQAIEVLSNNYIAKMLKNHLTKPGEKAWFCKYFGNKKAHELNLNVSIEAQSIINYAKNNHFNFDKKLSLSSLNVALKTSGVHINKDGLNKVFINIDRTPYSSLIPFSGTKESVLGILETVYHELQHCVQIENSNSFNKTTYNQFKERMVISANYAFYMQNHELFDIEREADEQAFLFLDETTASPLFEKYRATFNHEYPHRLNSCQLGKVKGKNEKILNYFDRMLIETPELAYNNWPLFKMEYDSQGKRRSLASFVDKGGYYFSLLNESYVEQYQKGDLSESEAVNRCNGITDLYYTIMYDIITETDIEKFKKELNKSSDYAKSDILRAVKRGKNDILAKRQANIELNGTSSKTADIFENKLAVEYENVLNYERIIQEQKQVRK